MMLSFLQKKKKVDLFDIKILRKNDISLLILDERWNSLFRDVDKPSEVLKCEEKVRDLLKEQSRLTAEEKEIIQKKKHSMDKIIQLTSKAYQPNSEEAQPALDEMQACEKEIKVINNRLEEINKRLEEIPNDIKLGNLELLNITVSLVYFKIAANRKRATELEKMILQTREKLKLFIDEKETLTKDGDDIYTYFHDLLGVNELERLDKIFFK